MTADIFGARFYGYRQPAWHRLGQVSTDRIGAVEALQRVGSYDVVLEPVGPNAYEIIRLATTDDASRRSFGRVSPDYQLIAPAELASLWDSSVGEPVETMGALRRGECLFLTMRMHAFQVRGDAVQNYLVLAHWMSAGQISIAFMSPVRVVCSNTLRIAERLSRARVDLAPTAGLRERISTQLQRVVRNGGIQSVVLRSQLEMLARRTVTRAEAEIVTAAAYPNDRQLRDAALDLFDGAGTGMDHPAAKGTLWGLYNAIAELENFREGGADAEAAADVLVGARAATMQVAFEAALALCRGRNPQPVPSSAPATSEVELVLNL